MKRIDKIILLGFITSLLVLLIFWLRTKRPDRDYLLPEDFSGWITVVHEFPGADALPYTDGAQRVAINDSGLAFTSTPLRQGWGRNQFFYRSDTGLREAPIKATDSEEAVKRIFRHEFYHYDHSDLIKRLPVGVDTVLWDGTQITVYDPEDIVVEPGRKTVEHLYFASDFMPVTFNPPPQTQTISDKARRLEQRR